MKYLTDEHVPPVLPQLLHAAGVDVRTIQECGLRGRPDEEILAFAADEGRCMVTSDKKDYDRLTRDFALQGLPHAGVVCVSRSFSNDQASAVAAGLIRLHEQYPDGVYPYFLVYLSRSMNS